MNYGFVKAAAAAPKLRVADCGFNADQIISYAKEASQNGAALVTFPELCVTGYTCSDLFLQSVLLKSAENAVAHILDKTKELDAVLIFGVPVAVEQSLYNCAFVTCKGKILGAVP
ncbi:MAG: nitrilase-related carbon-nitrogen hydrolase, partial [Clostridia bacterium]|nr:nitrilase-related carbon-nitrogen hydrolase [Clostridia bacterium]